MKYLSLIIFFFKVAYAEMNLNTALKTDLIKEVNQALSPTQLGCKKDEGGSESIDKALLIKESYKPIEVLTKNFIKLGGDPTSLTQALCFLEKNQNQNFKATGDPSRANGIKINNKRYITINDLNLSALRARFFILDLETGKVESYLSGHGEGGHNGIKGSDLYAEEFSNKDGSHATPRGFFITGIRREGSSDPRWKFSMRIHGLQEGINDKSFNRAVIIHPFPGLPDDSSSSDDEHPLMESDGPYALSHGCTMLSEGSAGKIVNKIKAASNNEGGSLYYNYTPIEKKRGATYCGEENLSKK
jgi:hypothetical protein